MTDEGNEQPREVDGGAHEQPTPPLAMPGVPGGGIPLPPVGGSFPDTERPGHEELPPIAPLSPPPPPMPAPTAYPVAPPIPPGGLPYGSYALGALSNLDRLTQQDNLLTAQLNLVSEQLNEKSNYLGLLRASGMLGSVIK